MHLQDIAEIEELPPLSEPTFCDCRLWCFRPHNDPAGADLMWSLLDNEERGRAEKFVFASDRERWVWWRSRLRIVLASELNLDPKELRFESGLCGKPKVVGSVGFHFNLSHTQALAVLAVSRNGEIGVDAERLDPQFPTLEVARNYFRPAECLALEQAPNETERLERFFRLWTAKEALMKATGLGMSLEPYRIEVTLDAKGWPVGYAWIDGFSAQQWALHCFAHGDHMVSIARQYPGGSSTF